MKVTLALKTIFRTPIKTLLTFMLLSATSYMLFSSVAEYVVTSREFKRTVGFYQGVGAVEVKAAEMPVNWVLNYNGVGSIIVRPANSTDVLIYTDERIIHNPYDYSAETIDKYKYEGICQDSIDALLKLPYVTAISTRYMTAGLSADLMRREFLRRDSLYVNYNYTARFIIEATFDHNIFKSPYWGVPENYSHAPPYRGASNGFAQWWRIRNLVFDNARLLAGDPEWFSNYPKNDNGSFKITIPAFACLPENPDTLVFGYAGLINERYTSVLHLGKSYWDDAYSYDALENLSPGARYIIIGRLDPMAAVKSRSIHDLPDPILTDPATIGWWPQIFPLNGFPEDYLTHDEFEPLRDMIDITNADLHTLDVVYTDDMSSIMALNAREMIISEGRALAPEDSQNHNNVCVINRKFITQGSLKIGDKIHLRLGSELFEQNAAVGAVASVRERYAESFTDEIEFEIVGAYSDVIVERERDANPYWSYSENTVFVPLSFLPAKVPAEHVFKPGELSIVIGDPRDISAFLSECTVKIKDELGLTLLFSDGGWLAVEHQISNTDTLTIAKLIMFSLAVLLAVGLTVYLFIGRKKKEYAVMRALGAPA